LDRIQFSAQPASPVPVAVAPTRQKGNSRCQLHPNMFPASGKTSDYTWKIDGLASSNVTYDSCVSEAIQKCFNKLDGCAAVSFIRTMNAMPIYATCTFYGYKTPPTSELVSQNDSATFLCDK
jgi:hypothetical protein